MIVTCYCVSEFLNWKMGNDPWNSYPIFLLLKVEQAGLGMELSDRGKVRGLLFADESRKG